MSKMAFLANWYNGPMRAKGYGHGPKPDNPGHGWHWLKKTDQGWDCIALVPGKAQHFETAQRAIDHARTNGFVVDADPPKFENTVARQ